MGVNVAAHTRHIFLGSAPQGSLQQGMPMLYTLLQIFQIYSFYIWQF